MLQNALPNQRLALGTRQIVLAVALQQYHLAALQLVLAVVDNAAHLHVQRLRRPQVLRQIDDARTVAQLSHVRGQLLRVRIEPLHLRLAQRRLDVVGQRGAELPAHVPDALQPTVQIGEQTALVALQRFVPELEQRHEAAIAGVRAGDAAKRMVRVLDFFR